MFETWEIDFDGFLLNVLGFFYRVSWKFWKMGLWGVNKIYLFLCNNCILQISCNPFWTLNSTSMYFVNELNMGNTSFWIHMWIQICWQDVWFYFIRKLMCYLLWWCVLKSIYSILFGGGSEKLLCKNASGNS